MTAPQFRPAGPEDAAILGRIHAAGWQSAYRGIASDDFLDRFTPEAREAYFARILPATCNEHYLICDDGEPVGMLALGPADDDGGSDANSGELIALYLLAKAQGKGLGIAAITFAADRLRALGYANITTTVVLKNERARRFYLRHGFVADGPVEPFRMGHTVWERRYRLT